MFLWNTSFSVEYEIRQADFEFSQSLFLDVKVFSGYGNVIQFENIWIFILKQNIKKYIYNKKERWKKFIYFKKKKKVGNFWNKKNKSIKYFWRKKNIQKSEKILFCYCGEIEICCVKKSDKCKHLCLKGVFMNW